MLSVLLLEAEDAIAHLLRFYLPSGGSLLDPTCGVGSLTKKLPSNVQLTSSDKEPHLDGAVRADIITGLPFVDGSFQAALFDPPYLYGRRSQTLYDRPDTRWERQHTDVFLPQAFQELVGAAASELTRLVTSLCIVKVMNSRFRRVYVDNAGIIKQAFLRHGWSQRDEIIYTRLGVGVFRNERTAQVAHGYFLVFSR